MFSFGKKKSRSQPFTLTLDEKYIKEIRYKLGSMEKRAPNLLANAMNRTLTQLQKQVPKELVQKYTYKRTLQVPEANRASYKKLRANLVYKPIAKEDIEKISFKSFEYKVGQYGTPRNTPGIKFQAKIENDKPFRDRDRVFESGDQLLGRVTHERFPLRHAVGPSETTMVKSLDLQPFTSKMLAEKLDEQINTQYLKKWKVKGMKWGLK